MESLIPHDRQLKWKWVGGMFALYVVLLVAAAGVFVSHESSRKLAHQPAMTVAAGAKQQSIAPASMPTRQVARY